MSDPHSLQVLQALVRRECRSLAQYTLGASPWTSTTHSGEIGKLLDLIEAERDALGVLTRYLYRHKVPQPHSGGYPTDFTSMNFADLHYIAGVLARAHADSIARLRDDLGLVHDEEGKRLGQALLDLKVKHLAELRQLSQPEPAVLA